MAFCLRSDGPRRLLGWFDLSDTDKEALLKMLKSLFGDGIELDMPGLRKMVETFMSLTDPATMLDRDRDSWMREGQRVEIGCNWKENLV